MERVVNPVKRATPNGKPGVKAMEKVVNPVPRGKARASSSSVGGENFHEKRDSVRSKKKV